MILQELVRLYDRLAQTETDDGPVVPPYGFTTEKVSFAIVITTDGDFVRIDDLRDLSGKKPVPVQMQVPNHWKRPGSGITPFFLCDTATFLLGLDLNDQPERAAQSFKASHELHARLAEGLRLESTVVSVTRFFEKWPEANIDTSSLPQDLHLGGNLVFRIDGGYRLVHESTDARDVWLKRTVQADTEKRQGTCLISGARAPIELVHPSIKGIRNGQSSGTSIVSFNLDAFESLGKQQGHNAPVSSQAAFQYVAALNHLTSAPDRRFFLADSTVVFWAERKTNFENVFAMTFSDYEGQASEEIRVNLQRLKAGKQLQDIDSSIQFSVLGLAPNVSRLSIRFWLHDTVGAFAQRISEHLHDSEIEKQYPTEPDVVPIWRMVNESATRYSGSGKTRRATYGEPNPRLAAELTRAVLTGTAYPTMLLSAFLARMRADGEINRIRTAAVKAVINRRYRKLERKEVPMALQTDYPSVGYQLGRLFAALERAQKLALGESINATIKDRYFGAASSTPGRVFPILIRLSQHHIAKAEYGSWIDRVIGEVMEEVKEFPSHLKIEEQGLFAIGYYHQRNAFFKRTTKTEEENG